MSSILMISHGFTVRKYFHSHISQLYFNWIFLWHVRLCFLSWMLSRHLYSHWSQGISNWSLICISTFKVLCSTCILIFNSSWWFVSWWQSSHLNLGFKWHFNIWVSSSPRVTARNSDMRYTYLVSWTQGWYFLTNVVLKFFSHFTQKYPSVFFSDLPKGFISVFSWIFLRILSTVRWWHQATC